MKRLEFSRKVRAAAFWRKGMLPLAERIERNSIPVTESGCWLWLHKIHKKSEYGEFCVEGKHLLAHRASWIAFRGKIPKGKCVCHHCDVRACVNPDHLFIGTHQENTNDARQKGRIKGPEGVLNGKAKLTVKQVLAIRSDPRLYRKIAKQFSVSIITISDIKRGYSWAHL